MWEGQKTGLMKPVQAGQRDFVLAADVFALARVEGGGLTMDTQENGETALTVVRPRP
jgi:hypothetical protein